MLLPALVAVALQQPAPQEALEAKLASPFLQEAEWVLDFDAARAAAAERKRLILGYFTTTGP